MSDNGRPRAQAIAEEILRRLDDLPLPDEVGVILMIRDEAGSSSVLSLGYSETVDVIADAMTHLGLLGARIIPADDDDD